MDQRYFLNIIFGFIGGIFLSSFFDLGYFFAGFLFLLGLFVFVYGKILSSTNKLVPPPLAGEGWGGVENKYFSISVFILFFALGVFRFHFSNPNIENIFLSDRVGERVIEKVLIIDEPDVRENNTRLKVEFLSQENFYDVNALLITSHYPILKYGDELEITGILKIPENFKNENGREFDYRSYLLKDGVYYEIFYPKIKLVSSGNGNFIKEKLFTLKNSFLENTKKVIPDPEVSFLGGLVVGAKQSLGKELQEDFRIVGLTHVIVLSGYNITIVADAVMRAFNFLPKNFGMSFGVLGIILFAVMTGASATIVRASIMALLVVLAKATGRTSDMGRMLFIAGFFMVAQNPKILVFDPSFQLSFLATLGLIYLSPRFEKQFSFISEKFSFRELVVATISTQIFVLPLLLYMTGQFSVVSLPANLLVLIFIPITMLFGFLTGILGFINYFISLPFGYVSYMFLAYELKVVEFFASLPFASISIKYFPVWLMIGIYIFYTYWILIIQPSKD